MQTTSLAPRPARPMPIHAVAPLERGGHADEAPDGRAREGATLRAPAVSQAKPMEEPLSDWQVFTLLGGTAGGMLTLGVAALYGLSLLLS